MAQCLVGYQHAAHGRADAELGEATVCGLVQAAAWGLVLGAVSEAVTAPAEACGAAVGVTDAGWYTSPAWVTAAAGVAGGRGRGGGGCCCCLAGKWRGSARCCLLQVACVCAGWELCGCGRVWIVVVKRR